ncbi:hypothetical protein VNI00_012844 [Paramarasmius palmivorus]|uniref:F-box domain-containing protein n=1 Tax=Paramarasmius palmivorus TaxID=297713 RepID=A0AAW0C383_9AGAR
MSPKRTVLGPEVLERIFRHSRPRDWPSLTFVSRDFRRISIKLIMESLTLEPANIEFARRRITRIRQMSPRPIVRHITFDVALSQWELLHHIAVACHTTGQCQSLSIGSSVHTADWEELAATFTLHLAAMIPNVTTLVLKPVDRVFQHAILSAYSPSVVRMTLHSAITTAMPDGWKPHVFPCLEEVNLVLDTVLGAGQESLPMLMAKYVKAPHLKVASIVGVTDGRMIGVQEFLNSYANTLETAKILGSFVFSDFDEIPLPALPRVSCIHIEVKYVHRVIPEGFPVRECFPSLRTLVLESDWKTIETGLPDIDWDELQEALVSMSVIRPLPLLVCGYRGPQVVHHDLFVRSFSNRMLEATHDHWNIAAVYGRLEQRRYDHLPTRTTFTDAYVEKRREEGSLRRQVRYGPELLNI